MHLGIADELTTELSQLCHVDVPGQLDVSNQVKINKILLMKICVFDDVCDAKLYFLCTLHLKD